MLVEYGVENNLHLKMLLVGLCTRKRLTVGYFQGRNGCTSLPQDPRHVSLRRACFGSQVRQPNIGREQSSEYKHKESAAAKSAFPLRKAFWNSGQQCQHLPRQPSIAGQPSTSAMVQPMSHVVRSMTRGTLSAVLLHSVSSTPICLGPERHTF